MSNDIRKHIEDLQEAYNEGYYKEKGYYPSSYHTRDYYEFSYNWLLNRLSDTDTTQEIKEIENVE